VGNINIPPSISVIDGGVFYGCSGITSVTIPNSVTSIKPFAFFDCSSLDSIVCKSLTPPYGVDYTTFQNISEDALFYVPCQTIQQYKGFDIWKTFNYGDCIDSLVNIPSFDKENFLHVFPNPTTGVLNLIQETINNEQLTINN